MIEFTKIRQQQTVGESNSVGFIHRLHKRDGMPKEEIQEEEEKEQERRVYTPEKCLFESKSFFPLDDEFMRCVDEQALHGSDTLPHLDGWDRSSEEGDVASLNQERNQAALTNASNEDLLEPEYFEPNRIRVEVFVRSSGNETVEIPTRAFVCDQKNHVSDQPKKLSPSISPKDAPPSTQDEAYLHPPKKISHDLQKKAPPKTQQKAIPQKKAPPISQKKAPPLPCAFRGNPEHAHETPVQQVNSSDIGAHAEKLGNTLQLPRKRKRARTKYEPENKTYFKYTNNDVLCQRGGFANKHPGNLKYHEDKAKLQPRYKKENETEKKNIVLELVKAVHERGGHFLEQEPKSGNWFEIHEKKAYIKASQALREDYSKEDRAAKRKKH